MPRQLRVHVPGGFYHVTLRGNHQQGIFIDEGDQRLLNKIVSRAVAAADARLHAYCWMSNHLHLLLQVDQQPLATPMRTIGCEFAREMQKKLGITGHFFERRYHASLVDVDSYFLALIRYIHLNPVEAGIVRQVGEYPWSSHHVYVGSRHEPWVTTEFALAMFGRNRTSALQAYRRFLDCSDAATWTPDQIARPKQFDAAISFAPRTEFASPTRALSTT
jgi:putative transposase